jgi:hypothetical protein
VRISNIIITLAELQVHLETSRLRYYFITNDEEGREKWQHLKKIAGRAMRKSGRL